MMFSTIFPHYLRLCLFQPVTWLIFAIFGALILLAHHPATTLFAFGQQDYMRTQLAFSSISLASTLVIVFAAALFSRQHEDQELAWLLVKPIRGSTLALSWFLAIFSTAALILLSLGGIQMGLAPPPGRLALAAQLLALLHLLMQTAVLSALAVPLAARWRFPSSSILLFILFILGTLNDHLRTLIPFSCGIQQAHPLMLLPSLQRFSLDQLLQQPVALPLRLLLLNVGYAFLWTALGVLVGAHTLRSPRRD